MELSSEQQLFRPVIFPPPQESRSGVVTVTERLSRDMIYSAYLQGIFPWFDESRGEPVVWWSPDPRFVLFPHEFHLPRRLARFVRRSPFRYTMNSAFEQVITSCAKVSRSDQDGTWIGPSMIKAYCDLFRCGVAHSVEVWRDNQLAGGFYGVLVGQVFFGESMFSHESDSAKSALVLFVEAFRSCGGRLIDSQVYTSNLARFGARNISRTAFLRLEQEFLPAPLEKELPAEFERVAAALTAFRQK